jgi:DNA-binding transcriptional LysR family regulator
MFQAVMEAGSVTEAARRLGVSQPAVSKMLVQFERALGFQVFVRDRKRLSATAEALALYNEVQRAFVSLDYLERFARDLNGLRRGHLVLAAPHGTSSGWLPGVISGFLRDYPGLSVSLQVLDTPRVAQAVATGYVDLGIGHFGVDGQNINQERLTSTEAVCVLPPHHRLVARKCVRPADLEGEPFIALAPRDRYRIALDTILQSHGVTRRIQIDTPLGASACSFVIAGMGIAVMDRLTATDNLHRGIVIRPFLPRIAEELTLLTPTRRPPSQVSDHFIACLRRYFSPRNDRRATQPAPLLRSSA